MCAVRSFDRERRKLTIMNGLVLSSLSHGLIHLHELPDVILLVVERGKLVRSCVALSRGPKRSVGLCHAIAVAVEDDIAEFTVVLSFTDDDLDEALDAVQYIELPGIGIRTSAV